MKKILCIGMSDVLGGIESVVLSYFKYLPTEEFSMDFLSFFPEIVNEKQILEKGSKVYHLTARGINPKKHHREVKEFFKNHGKDYDVIWYHCSSLSNGLIIKEVKKLKVPLFIIHGHASKLEVPSKLKELFHSTLHKINQKTLVQSGCWKVSCSKKSRDFFYQDDKADVIENGVEIDNFYFNLNKRDEIRRMYHIQEDEVVLGIASRFVPIKNLFFVLEVFRDYHFKNEKSKLMMVGEGDLKSLLVEKVKEYGLEDDVIWTGFQSELNDYLSSMDVYLLASYGEGFPVSVMEAQGSGLRGIISDRITDEVIKTELISQAPIDQGTNPWVDILMSMKFDYDRSLYQDRLRKMGVTTKGIAESFYEKLRQKLED